jgi:hypothetical protein
MLGQQEHIAKLVLDEEWGGGDAVSGSRRSQVAGLTLLLSRMNKLSKNVSSKRPRRNANEQNARRESNEKGKKGRDKLQNKLSQNKKPENEPQRPLQAFEGEVQEELWFAGQVGVSHVLRNDIALNTTIVRGRGAVAGTAGSGIGRGAPAARPPSAAGISRISRPSSVASTRDSVTRGRGRGV